MNVPIVCAVRKDIKEYFRGKKNVLFSITLFLIGSMIILTTLFFPSLISALANRAPDIISDTKSLDAMMKHLFPHDLRGSIGIWASDVGVFYTIIVVITVHGLVPDEIRNGKWIMPVANGYKKRELLLSKCLIYGMGAAFPVFILSNLYYFVAVSILEVNVNLMEAFIAASVLSVSIAGITTITILSSVLYKHSIIAGVSMIAIVMVAPDVLTYFSFGRYLPTHLLTYVYSMSQNPLELVVPLIELVIICYLLFRLASKKILMMEISR